ncbi:uncharacterized protein J3R85_005053 [Psidium guajava]|nr:uncharacterized protein J3R85_005053 [Psidium guajava]
MAADDSHFKKNLFKEIEGEKKEKPTSLQKFLWQYRQLRKRYALDYDGGWND